MKNDTDPTKIWCFSIIVLTALFVIYICMKMNDLQRGMKENEKGIQELLEMNKLNT